MRPDLYPYPGVEELDMVGTRTLFPLGHDRCLILTHNQYVRNPSGKPNQLRTNARSFSMALQQFDSIQFGRELSEAEVRRINFILKKAATRYVAAAKKEWLYPELGKPPLGWFVLDDDWFLMPDPWRVSFTTQISWGSVNGSGSSMDGYGRRPWEAGYQDPKQKEIEWVTHQKAKHEWALKRRNCSRAKTMDHTDAIHDKLIDEFMHDWDEAHRRKERIKQA